MNARVKWPARQLSSLRSMSKLLEHTDVAQFNSLGQMTHSTNGTFCSTMWSIPKNKSPAGPL